MSIFGLTNSKFIYTDPLIDADTTVDLYCSVLDPNWSVPDEIMHTSIINGNRNWLISKWYSEFTVMVHLWKYSIPAYTKFSEIFDYKNKLVSFYPHSDGLAIQNEYGDTILFYVAEVIPYYITNLTTYDVCKIKFISSEYTALVVNVEGYGYHYAEDYGEHF